MMDLEGKKLRFFLSYGPEEAPEWVLRLKRELVARGHEVWMDTIDAGDGLSREARRWEERIEYAIEEADACLFLIGPDAALRASRSDLLRREIAYAAERDKRIVPITYGGVDWNELPDELALRYGLHVYGDARDAGILQDLIDTVYATGEMTGAEPPDEASRGGLSPSVPPSPEAPAPEPVRFTAFFPTELQPEVWRTLLAYVHVPSAEAAVQEDSREQLDTDAEDYKKGKGSATDVIARGAEITVVPEMPGVRFNPPRASVLWLEDWHRVEFRLQAAPQSPEWEPGTATNGRLYFFVGPVLVGEVKLWASFVEEGSLPQPEASDEHASADAYQAIFVSYSHRDAHVVEQLGNAYKVLGNRYFRDVETLRSGQEWMPALEKMIDEADVFQLCWSNAAKQSKYVEQEWRYAKRLSRNAFIRPFYWEDPMPAAPTELAGLHFARLSFARS